MSHGCCVVLQLILGTIPEDGETSAPYIVTNRNLLLLFDIQKKVEVLCFSSFNVYVWDVSLIEISVQSIS